MQSDLLPDLIIVSVHAAQLSLLQNSELQYVHLRLEQPMCQLTATLV